MITVSPGFKDVLGAFSVAVVVTVTRVSKVVEGSVTEEFRPTVYAVVTAGGSVAVMTEVAIDLAIHVEETFDVSYVDQAFTVLMTTAPPGRVHNEGLQAPGSAAESWWQTPY